MFKLVCKRQLRGQKYQVKGNMNGRRHTLKVGCGIGGWKLLSK